MAENKDTHDWNYLFKKIIITPHLTRANRNKTPPLVTGLLVTNWNPCGWFIGLKNRTLVTGLLVTKLEEESGKEVVTMDTTSQLWRPSFSVLWE